MGRKRINIGEYIILTHYETENAYLNIQVLDEGEEVIDFIEISDDEEDQNSEPSSDLPINLN